jgi:hypothetical protein
MTVWVRQTGASLQIVTLASFSGGDQRDSTVLTIGGPAVTRTLPNAASSVESAAVESGRLATRATVRTPEGEINVHNAWALAPDGRTLTIQRTVVTPGGDFDLRGVFNRR